jgi:hypothetical protein
VTEGAGAPSAPGVSRARELAGALLLYVMLALIFTWGAWRDSEHRWVGICCDQEQAMWFLAWAPTALERGESPLLTDRLNAPVGANLMWNTPSTLPALALAPLTQTLGPIVTYDIAVVLAIALSGLACFAALRRSTSGALGPLIGGALYALSPYVASHTTLHLNLIFVWAPPLFLILLDELLVRRRYRPELVGAALGALGALQLITAEEVLATCAVAGAVLAIVLAIVVHERSAIVESTKRLARAGVPGFGVFLLIGGYPLAVQFLGPLRLHGAVNPAAVFSMDILNPILPTSYQLFAPDSATAISQKFSGLFHEATGYIGLPLLLVLAVVVVELRRDQRVIVAAAVAVVMLVLSLGPELHIAGVSQHVPLPWLAISSLPLLEHVLPGRLTLYAWLAIAVLIALAIDRATGLDRRRAGVQLAAIGIALAFVLPAPAASSTTSVPAFFSSWEQQGIADSDIVLFAPWFTDGAGADPMLWAAVAHAQPRIYEGYVFVPDAAGHPRFGPAPGTLGNLMMQVQDHGTHIVLGDAGRAAAARQLVNVGISEVIIGPMVHQAEMIDLFTQLLGSPPTETGGVFLWRNVQGLVPH